MDNTYQITETDARYKRVMEVFRKESERLSNLFGVNMNYVEIRIRPMGVKTIGQARYNKWFPMLSLIEINSNFLRDWENFNHVVTHTVTHELVHIFANRLYGDAGAGHGKIWKQLMVKAGVKPNRTFKNTIEVHGYTKRKYKRYILQCSNCKREISLTPRAYKRIGIYQCADCKTRLMFAELLRTENI